MPEAGFTPVQLYRSDTATAVPADADMVAGELAINTTDQALYALNTAGDVVLMASGFGVLPVLASDPTLAAGEGAAYIKLVSGEPAVFIKVFGFAAIRLNVGADLNVSIPSSVLAPAAVNAVANVTANQFGSTVLAVAISAGNATFPLDEAGVFTMSVAENFTATLTATDVTKAYQFTIVTNTSGTFNVTSITMTGITVMKKDGETINLKANGYSILSCLYIPSISILIVLEVDLENIV